MSLLDTKKYPLEVDVDKYLIFESVQEGNIHPIFKMRLAAFARDVIKGKMFFLEGSRTYDRQVYFYKQSGGKQNSNGVWYGGNGTAAVPGTSRHEFDVAVDTGDAKVKAIDKDAATNKQTTLIKYGIYKPLTKGNGKTVCEDWHIEAIETNSIDKVLLKEDAEIWRDKLFIQSKCKFSNMFDVFDMMDKHKYAKSMYSMWKNSYLNNNTIPRFDREVIQSKCKFSDPNGVWNVLKEHKYFDSLLQKWADSYNI